MGLENRDYLRNDGGGQGSSFSYQPGGSTQSICKLLIIINVVVYVLQLFTGDFALRWLTMSTDAVASGQIWRLLTYGFCHAEDRLLHIVFNMLLLWWLGPRLEAQYGSREFLTFYLVAIVASALAYMGLDLITGRQAPMLGASGGVSAVLALYACHYPRQIVYLAFVIPVEIRWLVLLYAIFDLHPVLLELANKGKSDQVAHAAHLGGLLFGYIYYKKGLRLSGMFGGLSQRWKAKRRGLRVVSEHDDPKPSRRVQKLEAEMDAILDKINREGEASLSKKERKALENASRELRNRRKS